jgi:dTDP-4-amino-4,6-dideoxygalactose transaminase
MSGGKVLKNRTKTTEELRLLHTHEQRKICEHVVPDYGWRLARIRAIIGWIRLRMLDAILGNSGTQLMARRDNR